MWKSEWKKGVDYPVWGDTEIYKKTISGGYLINGESPKDAYMRVAKTVAKRLYKPKLADKFFDIYGKDGYALLPLFYLIQVLIEVYL